MPITCVIPCKPYRRAKTRLVACLTPEQRVVLSRQLLLRTIHLASSVLDRVVVISRDRGLLAEAERAGAQPLVEARSGLNAALTQAARFITSAGAGGMLVLPADLPLLTTTDIATMLSLAATPPAVIIAPCRHEIGTNALLVAPPLVIPFVFGGASFRRHVAAAAAHGIEPIVFRSPTVAFDLDTPDDWHMVSEQMSTEYEFP